MPECVICRSTKGGAEEDKQVPVDNHVSLLLLCEGTSTCFDLLSDITESIIYNRRHRVISYVISRLSILYDLKWRIEK